jgi:hypothetical protein
MPVSFFPFNPAFLDILTSVNKFTAINLRIGLLATDAPRLIAGKTLCLQADIVYLTKQILSYE